MRKIMTEIVKQQKNPLMRALLAYCGMVVLAQIAIEVITSYVEMQSSAMGIIVIFAAAMGAGGVFATAAKRVPTRGEKFKFAVLATLAGMAIAYLALWGAFWWYSVPFNMDSVAFGLAGGDMNMALDLKEMLPFVLAIAAVVNLLFAYLGLGMGAKQNAKQQAKLAAKSQ
jgi:hypothetical protein